MGVNLTGAAATGAHIPRIPEGSRISRVRPWTVKRTYREADPTAWTACPEDFRWLRLPVRVERPRDVFNGSVLNVRQIRGVASY